MAIKYAHPTIENLVKAANAFIASPNRTKSKSALRAAIKATETMFEEHPDSQAFREAARREYEEEGEIEIDDNALISRGDDNGAYVAAWVWVSHADLPCVDCDEPITDEQESMVRSNGRVSHLDEEICKRKGKTK